MTPVAIATLTAFALLLLYIVADVLDDVARWLWRRWIARRTERR
jgi:hypothetical protein